MTNEKQQMEKREIIKEISKEFIDLFMNSSFMYKGYFEILYNSVLDHISFMICLTSTKEKLSTKNTINVKTFSHLKMDLPTFVKEFIFLPMEYKLNNCLEEQKRQEQIKFLSNPQEWPIPYYDSSSKKCCVKRCLPGRNSIQFGTIHEIDPLTIQYYDQKDEDGWDQIITYLSVNDIYDAGWRVD